MKSIVHSLDATNTKMIAAISRIPCLMSLIVLSFHCVFDKFFDELAHWFLGLKVLVQSQLVLEELHLKYLQFATAP